MAAGLFDYPDAEDPTTVDAYALGPGAPLAARMRPRTLDEIVGQDHIVGDGKPLRRLLEGRGKTSVILYGPPGTGKTTIALVIGSATGARFVSLSALSAGVKEVRQVIARARDELAAGRKTVLFIDEVHRFSKTQQDALLHAVENQIVLLVAATTENPSFSVVAPLLSRSLIVETRPLDDDSLTRLVTRAVAAERGLNGSVTITDDATAKLVALAGGDARRCLTYLDAAADAAGPSAAIDTAVVEGAIDKAASRYDRDGDQHYDITSAFIKSVRGSDVDAALHYLARMIDGGEDPRFIARRLIILASEDIGLADPTSLTTAVAAAQAVALIGMPEARLTLSQATIHLALAPKSNAAYVAIDAALADVRAGKTPPVPAHLRDGHYEGAAKLGHAVGYVYPHDDDRGVVNQRYIPDQLDDASYYVPTNRGAEKRIAAFFGRLRELVRGR